MSDLVHRLHQEGTIVLETIVPGDGRRVVWLFERPDEVLIAREGRELFDLMRRLEEATARGRYAAGYFAYEAGYALEPAFGAPTSSSPLAWFGVYADPVELAPDAVNEAATAECFEVGNEWFEYTRQSYGEAFQRLKHHIFEGDVYQVNLTGRLAFSFTGSPIGLYAAISRGQTQAYGGFLRAGQRTILSRSPELFFMRDGSRIVTRPMKGTHRRGRTAADDAAHRLKLASDPKSRAENLMIVDLLRNDLSVVCEPGSVRVPDLFSTEVHETLIQMTSTVEGTLRAGTTTGDVLRALFPCGSVTGAPKIRAMQIIADLERSPRGAYCGAVGWTGPGGRAVFNVAIRTAEIEGDKGRLGVGSGVVWDSLPDDEFDECLLKAQFFMGGMNRNGTLGARADFELIETMLWRGVFPLLPLHMKRLVESADVLGFALDPEKVMTSLEAATRTLEETPHRVRVRVSREGAVVVATEPIPDGESGPWRIAIAATRARSDDPLLRHKTSRRGHFERILAAGFQRGIDEVIFLNERDEVCQGTRSNVVVRHEGVLFTPPVASGLLPGVYRAHLLQTRNDLVERVLSLADLVNADKIFVCNAIRGLQEAHLERDERGRVLLIDVLDGRSEVERVVGEPHVPEILSIPNSP